MGIDTRARMAREVWSLSEWFVLREGGGGAGAGEELQINVQLLCAGQFYKLRNLQYLYIVL